MLTEVWGRLGPPADPVPRWYAVDGAEAGGLQIVERRPEPRGPADAVPNLLGAEWYPGDVTPPVVPAVLGHLSQVVLCPDGSGGVPDDALGPVVAAVYHSLTPGPELLAVLDTGADWLERVADRLGEERASPEWLTRVVGRGSAEPLGDLAGRLIPLRAQLREWAVSAAAPSGLPPAEAQARVVARLAHCAVVVGGNLTGHLRVEAAVVRSLADGLRP